MRIGFIGLGNIGGKLARSLQRNGQNLLYVKDLDPETQKPFLERGAKLADSPRQMAEDCDLVITCLPSPSASASVMEGDRGVIEGLSKGKIWAEMSTTDESEIQRLASLVQGQGAESIDCPVSGGCHRADTGNISIFAGCARPTFERALPVLTTMGRRILHTGDIGSASVLKVVTNYLASANLVSISEALVTTKAAGIDLTTAFEAIRISSGNSFVHETESQVILNGSRNISFTMDLVQKDLGLFAEVAQRGNVKLEMLPLLQKVFAEGQSRYGPREWSSNIIKRLEEDNGVEVQAPGYPSELVDTEAEERGAEVKPVRIARVQAMPPVVTSESAHMAMVRGVRQVSRRGRLTASRHHQHAQQGQVYLPMPHVYPPRPPSQPSPRYYPDDGRQVREHQGTALVPGQRHYDDRDTMQGDSVFMVEVHM